MKIAYIVDVFPNLSSDTFILNQITGLLDRRCEVDIYAKIALGGDQLQPDVIKYKLLDRTFYYDMEMPKNMLLRIIKAFSLIILNLRYKPISLLKSLNIFKFGKEALSLKLLYATVPFLDKGPYDVIHCHFGPNGSLGVRLRELGIFKSPIITTFHGYDIRLALEEGAGIYKRLFREGDVFLSICDYNYKKLISFGVDKERIVYHPVGIDLAQFQYKWNSEDLTEDKKIKVLTVARLVRVKALENGIMAINKIHLEHPDIDLEYNIVGDGYLTQELTQLIQDLKLEKIVHLLGPKKQNEIVNILRSSHIFVLPSLAEALPVSLMEAQAVGLPVIATDVGSVDEVLVMDESGYCVPASDVEAIAEKLYLLIVNPWKWPIMGRIGRKNIEDNFNIDILNDRLLDLCKSLLNEDIWHKAGYGHYKVRYNNTI